MLNDNRMMFLAPVFACVVTLGSACSIHIDQVNAEGTVNQQFDGENEVNGADSSADSARSGKKETPKKGTAEGKEAKEVVQKISQQESQPASLTVKL